MIFGVEYFFISTFEKIYNIWSLVIIFQMLYLPIIPTSWGDCVLLSSKEDSELLFPFYEEIQELFTECSLFKKYFRQEFKMIIVALICDSYYMWGSFQILKNANICHFNVLVLNAYIQCLLLLTKKTCKRYKKILRTETYVPVLFCVRRLTSLIDTYCPVFLYTSTVLLLCY